MCQIKNIFQQLQSDLNDAQNEAKNAEDRARKSAADAARLSDELRAEQEHAQSMVCSKFLFCKVKNK